MTQISKSDYESLLAFRTALRRFLHFTEQGARAVGLTPQQHQVLLAVMGQPGRDWASVGEIAEALQIRHHAAVGLIDRCQQAGVVMREHDPTDRRTVRVSLTDQGKDVLQRLSSANLAELKTLTDLLKGF
ncbi:MarR family winged helix-turn-helix transcriptional regulator [Fimbriimonas ginsengisoli]|uniref:Transcriptional regulator, MarR family n=1 Tax=Fimbriimonas ginsengisoli Gsoil 348 TaxID=661478 RepID=A0A068NQ85_FIMGI|nr:MarR family transcriptional regulator [Fimbriimonas ginsengisoli]AIE83779.1 transcriptional regulator, MarR family [Fimbriimonas ginsengisoli Gsoil 348]